MDVVSVDELNQKIATLEKEKNKEEEYRNYMQLERVSCRAGEYVNPQTAPERMPVSSLFGMSLTCTTRA